MARDRIGKYVVVRKLGEGGMGSVVLARHAQIRREVAIKILHPQYLYNDEVKRRFFNEARATAELKHPGLVEIFDFGNLDDGSAYLVMEYLEGETLADRIARGPVGPALAAEIGRQLSSAVGAAHARGIVHRDLKPENVILISDPDLPHKVRVKAVDFGIAKLASDASVKRTATNLLLGTPAYMSPEQCRAAAAVDHRTDIYALGCILFEMTCGRPPFASENMAELIAAHLSQTPEDPLELVPSMPIELRDCILRCLAKNPKERFQHANDLAERLRDVATCGAQKRERPHQFTDDETRFDPQIAARIAIEWSDELTTTEKPKVERASRDSASGRYVIPASNDRGELWQKRVAVAAMIAGAVGLAAVIMSVSIPSASGSAPRKAAANPIDASVRVDAAANRTPKDVELRIETTPPGAEVVSGPIVLGTTPLRIVTKASPGTAALEIRAPGFGTRTIDFATDSDEHFTIRLRPTVDHRRLLANREPTQDGDDD